VYTATVYVKQLLLPAAVGDEMELQFHSYPLAAAAAFDIGLLLYVQY